jgi:hypothetical protein
MYRDAYKMIPDTMKIKPLYIFTFITILGSLLLLFLISLKFVSPHLIVDRLMDIDSVRNLPAEDHSKMASLLRENSAIRTIYITLSLPIIIAGILGIWVSTAKK